MATRARAFILAAFALLCALNNVSLPVFEAPDEVSHYTYAAYLARARALPDLRKPLPAHEAAQPPLYYALVALAISPIDQSNLPEISRLNPDWFDRALNPDLVSVANQHVHSDAERFPWRGAVWGVRIARAVSTVLGLLTLLGIFTIAKTVIPGSQYAPLLATAAVAFTPKFVHVASIVSNDIAIICAATLACAWLCRLLAAQQPPARRQLVMLGALVGAAVLCKLGGLGLLAPTVIALFARDRARGLRMLAWVGAGLALTAGPWFVYNMARYGDPLALGPVGLANAALLRPTPLSWQAMFGTIPALFQSYFGALGVGFALPVWARLIFAAGFLSALVGCVLRVGKALTQPPTPQKWLASPLGALILWQMALIALFVPWLRAYSATENGRLILPGIGCAAMLVTLGWLRLAGARPRAQQIACGIAGTMLFATAAATPFTTLQPAFATPSTTTEAAAQSRAGQAQPLAVFDGKVVLVHAAIGAQRVRGSEPIAVTLQWGARQPIEQSYRVLLEALDPDGALVGRRVLIPFGGRFDTQRWQPGEVFEDAYALPLELRAESTAVRVQLSLIRIYGEPDGKPGLVPIDGATSRSLTLGRVKVVGNQALPAAPGYARFGDGLILEHWSFKPDSSTFVWRVETNPGADYTLFVKAYDATGAPVIAIDAQPFNGFYPTGLWEAGERVRDVRALQLSDSVKRVDLGWYDSSGQRLPAYKPDGSRWLDDIVSIAR